MGASQVTSSDEGLGLRSASDRGPLAFATSLLSAQTLVKGLLGTVDTDQTIPLPQHLLDFISARQGEPVSTESLEGVTRKMASLKVDVSNHTLLLNRFNAEGNTR